VLAVVVFGEAVALVVFLVAEEGLRRF